MGCILIVENIYILGPHVSLPFHITFYSQTFTYISLLYSHYHDAVPYTMMIIKLDVCSV